MNTLEELEDGFLRDDIPDFNPGDTVIVHVRVVEGGRERVQLFEGVVIARSGTGARETFTVRKVAFGVGVERIFPVHAPILGLWPVLCVRRCGCLRESSHASSRAQVSVPSTAWR